MLTEKLFVCQVRLFVAILLLPLLFPACSKSARATRYLKEAQASMIQGDLHLDQGKVQEADGAYQKVEKLVALVQQWLPSSSPYASKAGELKLQAQHKRESVRGPEGCVLAMIDAMQGTRFEDFKLISDLQACIRLALGDQAWEGLGRIGQDRLRVCAEAAIQHWLQTRVDALKIGQPRITDKAGSGDHATVKTDWRSTVGEVVMIFECHLTNGRWQVFNFKIPLLETSLSDYIQKTVAFMATEGKTLPEVLALPDAKERCVQAFETAEETILDVDDSVVGKTVTLSGDPAVTYQVAKQATREDGVWILVRPAKDPSGSGMKWTLLSEAKVVDADSQVWGMQ